MAYNSEVIIHKPINKTIEIKINGLPYLIKNNISLKDGRILFDCFKETSDYKKAFASMIHNKISNNNKTLTPSLDEIIKEEDSIFYEFINSVIEDTERLQIYFNEIDNNTPIIKRFYLAHEKYFNAQLKKVSESIYELTKDIDFTAFIDNFYQAITSFISKIDFSFMEKAVQNYSNAFSEIIKKLYIPDISEERKTELINSYNKWGEFGWSLLPNISANLFKNEPIDMKNANKIALNFCKSDIMENLFVKIKKQNIKISDFEEAVFCYKHKKYKACILLLFGLIDAKMIRIQSKFPNYKDNRSFGNNAIKILKKLFDEINENTLDLLLKYLNLFSCLNTFFSSRKNFKNEPITTNRHFLAHGMSTKRARKRDCIQLFLVLYNLSDFIDYITIFYCVIQLSKPKK